MDFEMTVMECRDRELGQGWRQTYCTWQYVLVVRGLVDGKGAGRMGNLDVQVAVDDTEVLDIEFFAKGGDDSASKGGIRCDDQDIVDINYQPASHRGVCENARVRFAGGESQSFESGRKLSPPCSGCLLEAIQVLLEAENGARGAGHAFWVMHEDSFLKWGVQEGGLYIKLGDGETEGGRGLGQER